MFVHEFYAGVSPKKNVGSKKESCVQLPSVIGKGVHRLKFSAELPTLSTIGAIRKKGSNTSSVALTGFGRLLACGSYHTGEEVT